MFGTSVIYLHIKFHIPPSNRPSIIINRNLSKFPTAAMFLFNILQKIPLKLHNFSRYIWLSQKTKNPALIHITIIIIINCARTREENLWNTELTFLKRTLRRASIDLVTNESSGKYRRSHVTSSRGRHDDIIDDNKLSNTKVEWLPVAWFHTKFDWNPSLG